MTASIMPAAIERNAGMGTRRMAERLMSTVRPLKKTALPAVSMVTATARGRSVGAAWMAPRKRETMKRA